ncbi:MAG: amidohydrolase family protein [Methylacidiphilales bacterium]|nr:amidohydrolase family protein [Candidatus Methylacidiphilales bacterium]
MIKAIDCVVNIWTTEALAVRPSWTNTFFIDKMKGKHNDIGISLETMLSEMDSANIEVAFLVAAKSGRLGLPGSYHMPLEIVAEACKKYPHRLFGLCGIDPTQGMQGVRALEYAVTKLGFIGAHLYPHWFELPPDHAKYYPFYSKCIELDIPIQIQVGQSLIYAKEQRLRSVGKPISLDSVACDLPELKIIGSHVGIPWHEEMIAMAWKHENIFIATDAHSPKYWPPSVTRYINSFGKDKALFATDFPVLRFARTREEIEQLNLKPEVQLKFLRNNAIRLYKLDQKGITYA